MITFFSIPKPFFGEISKIQKNAINSWKKINPSGEIILFGDEAGIKKICDDLNIHHIPNINCNKYGTPLLSDVFTKINHVAKNNLLCYVNTDIILMPDFLAAINRMIIKKQNFLLVGQRIDLEVNYEFDFSQQNWEDIITSFARTHGKIHPPGGSDYFVFYKNSLERLPDFVVGRPGWDNWMIYSALNNGLAVVDISQCTLAIHQNHDYAHIPNGDKKTYHGPEAEMNLKLLDRYSPYTLSDSNWILYPDGLKHKVLSDYLYKFDRKIKHFLKYYYSRWKR
jgi:hypothetical protein